MPPTPAVAPPEMPAYVERRRLAAVACAVLLVAGCGEPPDVSGGRPASAATAVTAVGLDSLKVIRTTVLYSGERISLPTELAVLDSGTLLITDPYLPGLHTLDLATGDLLGTHGREGKGPQEFTYPAGIGVLRNGGAVLIGDPGAGRIVKVSTDSLLARRYAIEQLQRIDIPFRQLIPILDGRLIASDLSGRTRFLVFDEEGNLRDRVGDPPGSESSLPPEVAGRAYAQVLAVHPIRPLVASGAVHGGSLAIFDLGGKLVDSVAVPTPFEPRVEVGRGPDGRPVMRLGAKARFGYVGLAATCQYIVALYSGRGLLDHSGEASAAGQIHLFSWDGRFLQAFELDRAIRGIAIAGGITEDLYGVHWGTNPSIVRFRLPGLDITEDSLDCTA